MLDPGPFILTLSLLVVGSILAGSAGTRVGAPLLLVFLVAGMLAGREGPGGIDFDQAGLAHLWASAALAAILFDGGLRTQVRILLAGLRPGLMLAVPGTLITALLTAPVAALAFGLGPIEALLLGAVVASTDAAAVFALASTALRLPERVASTLEVESGFNDPIAILLVVALAEIASGQPVSWWAVTLAPVAKLVGGVAVGVAFGWAAAYLLGRVYLPDGLYTILAAAFGFTSFGFGETVGASGFLAVYLCGVTIAWRSPFAARKAAAGVDSVAWLAQTGLFLMLGLFITPSHLAVVALPATLTALGLMLISRPLAVFISLRPFRFTLAESTFIAWTGLRGATPVYLGLLPLIFGVPNASLYLSVAASVVLVSLVVQAWSAPLVARQLGLGVDEEPEEHRREILMRIVAMALVVAIGVWFSRTLVDGGYDVVKLATTDDLAQWASDSPERENGLAVAALPPDFAEQPAEVRQDLLTAVLAGVMASVNAEIAADREVALTLAAMDAAGQAFNLGEQADRDRIARRYGVTYRDLDELLLRVDIVPPSLAVAQAALATGWGGSADMLARNDLFGNGGRSGDGRYGTLVEAARAYAQLLNTHRDFADLRDARAALRAAGAPVTGLALARHIGPYAASGADYADSVAAVIATRSLGALDTGPPP